MTRAKIIAAVVAAVGVGVAGGVLAYRRLRPDPAREMMRKTLPAWQAARAHQGKPAARRRAR